MSTWESTAQDIATSMEDMDWLTMMAYTYWTVQRHREDNNEYPAPRDRIGRKGKKMEESRIMENGSDGK